MRHSFPGHPAGAAGAALLLLRLSAALILGAAYISIGASPADPWLPLALGAAAALLLVGLGTRVTALVATLMIVALGLYVGRTNAALAALEAPNLAAIALLGAGAYSIDAYLFGRRVIDLR